jgi:hypothetical protein
MGEAILLVHTRVFAFCSYPSRARKSTVVLVQALVLGRGNVVPSEEKSMSKHTAGGGSDAPSLVKRLTAWMNSEGYPTEFRTANKFRQYGFHARQGEYIKGREETKREIDVLAWVSVQRDYGFIRVCYVVECKWSLEKPWIVFTSPTTKMATSAMAAQTISSTLGAATMWAIAGHEELKAMDTFLAPIRGGFGGRQAFSTGRDHFYSAVQSAVANAAAYASSYDEGERWGGAMPEACIIVFPIVVIEGDLFEASFDQDINDVSLKSVDKVRCHWMGSTDWKHRATVDIVSLSHLDIFLAQRRDELKTLVNIIEPAVEAIDEYRKSGSLTAVKRTEGPRGFRGLPPLLQEFRDAFQIGQNKPKPPPFASPWKDP